MTVTPFYQDESVTLYHGDCREILPQLGAVDHVITDPPYSAHVHSKSMRGAVGWKGEIAETRDLGFEALDDQTRLLVGRWCASYVKRWIAVFSDTESAHLWREALGVVTDGCWLEYVRTVFWHKVGGAPQFTGDRPAVACEAITLCHQTGRKRWNGGGKQGIYSVPIVLDRGASATEWRCHTTQKPEELMKQLVADFTDIGEMILDPFAGSGTTLVAAKRLNRKAIGIELDEGYCRTIVRRLAQGALGLEMEHTA
jgi:DNA modification methylase